mgnify:CR=1 FL=1
MKTTKKLVVLCMVLLMGIVAVMPSTFSWYDHSGSQTGDSMKYKREELPVSAGTISVETKKYKMKSDKKTEEGKTPAALDYKEVYYDNKGNKEYGDAITNGSSVSASRSQYYGTTITNSGDAPAYVNLYLQNFTNNSSFYVGTLEPSLRDKNAASSVHIKNKNMIRVYFQWKNANDWKTSGANHYVVYKTKTNSNWQYKAITNHLTAATAGTATRTRQNNILGSDNIADTYYVNLDDDTTQFYFATDGNSSGFNTSDCSTTMNWYRTNIITDVQAERGYYLTGVADDTYFTAACQSFSIPGGISVMKYFDTANLNNGQKSYVSLTNGTHYTGQTASYAVTSGTGSLSVSGAGLMTRTGASQSVVTTTITGSLGDTTTVTTTVTTPSTIAAMPLSMNIEVPEKKDGVDGKAEVVWYIRNEDSSTTCTFANIYYTK